MISPDKTTGRMAQAVAFTLRELKPRGRLFTPFNVISAPIILTGAVLIIYRFLMGLGAVTNPSDEFPWGIWISFNVMTGVAFAGGAYVLTFVVYILRSEKYHPIIRPTVLNGFLAYVFYASAILFDLGRWWNIANPLIGNSFGVNSVLFLVAWHFLLYMIAQLIEFSPAVAEWLGLRRIRKTLTSLTLGAVIFGVTLSTLHQSGLGALVMMAQPNMHPLWYTEFIPILFFVSSIFAGLSVVIVQEAISRKVFQDQIDKHHRARYDGIVTGLARGCAGAMFGYFFLKSLVFIHGNHWSLLNTPMGYWYLVETIGFVLIPCFVFLQGARHRNLAAIRVAALVTMAGIIINRFNYVFIAYKWYIPLNERYVPHWMEVTIALTIVLADIWAFRWIANRMPVFRKSPQWAIEQDSGEQKEDEKVIAIASRMGGRS